MGLSSLSMPGRTPRVPRGAVARPMCMRALGLLPPYSVEDVKKAYRDRAAKVHPDAGGDAEAFKALHRAYEQALQYAQFRESRRLWLADRVETYAERERIVSLVEAAGGRCDFSAIDDYLEEFGRDFAEVLREVTTISLPGPGNRDEVLLSLPITPAVAREVHTLVLRGATLTSSGLQKIPEFESLRALDLYGASLPGDAFSILEDLPRLGWLNAGRTGLNFWTRRRMRREFPRLTVVTKKNASPPPDSHWDPYLDVLRRLEQL